MSECVCVFVFIGIIHLVGTIVDHCSFDSSFVSGGKHYHTFRINY